jgi:hypothetical protein
VDNSGDFACALVTRFYWSCWRWIDPPVAGDRSDHIHCESGLRKASRLIPFLAVLKVYLMAFQEPSATFNWVLRRGIFAERLCKSPGGNARALSTASSASSASWGEALLHVVFNFEPGWGITTKRPAKKKSNKSKSKPTKSASKASQRNNTVQTSPVSGFEATQRAAALQEIVLRLASVAIGFLLPLNRHRC